MNVFKFLLAIVKENKLLFFFLFFCAASARVLDILLPFFFKRILDDANKVVNLKTSIDTNIIWINFFLLCFMALLSRVFFRAFDYVEMKFVPSLREKIISTLFSHITKHSMSYFQNNFSGSIAHTIKQITDTTKEFLINFSSDFLQIFVVLITTTLLISFQSPILAGFIISFGLFYVYISFVLATKAKDLAINWSKENSLVSGKLIDSIENIFLIKSLGREKTEEKNLNVSLKDEKESLTKLKTFMVKAKFLHVMYSSALIVSCVFVGVYLFLQKEISIGDLTLLYLYITRLGGEFHALGDKINDFLEKFGILKEGLEFIYVEQDDEYNKPKIQIDNGEICFNNVSFKYKNGKEVFNNLNLHIKPNEKVALVGFSGSGKSTLTKLISKHFNVSSGEILLDKQFINDYNINSINESITHIQQEAYLFNRSIRDNILYSKPEASEEELLDVCRKSGCLEFILEKPNQFDTIVGERGVQLSGGEKQRIALARAFLLNNPILILDEPTSALDSISEKIIQNSLIELMKNKTVIIIAHRLSTISNMDRVLVMNNGNIVEDGKHDELLQNNSFYKKLWSSQETLKNL
jgi:ATP-binding cassette subfamily B protein